MFIDPEELKTVIYEYQLQEITEEDPDIVMMAIGAAVEEMKSYIRTNNQGQWNDGRIRYDATAIFSATDNARNPLILELCKNITLWYVCRLANMDVIHDKIKERYDRAIDWLEKLSGTGKSAGSPALTPDLPVLVVPDDETSNMVKYGSRDKFNHE